ncbi:hypothetical protein ACQPYE_17175 [Actinosynnema sp. CA-299493]
MSAFLLDSDDVPARLRWEARKALRAVPDLVQDDTAATRDAWRMADNGLIEGSFDEIDH